MVGVKELFGNYAKLKSKYPEWKRRYLKKILKKAIVFCLSFPVVVLQNQLVWRKIKRCNRIRYIFIGNHFPDLIAHLPKEEVVVLGPITKLKALRNQYNWLCYDWCNLLLVAAFYLDFNPFRLSTVFDRILRSNNDLHIITGNDTKPLERYFLEKGRHFGHVAICIQHGIWVGENIHKFELDGWFADKILVYDDYHFNLLAGFGMEVEKISILGFPKTPIVKSNRGANKKICIIGSGFSILGKREEITRANNILFDKIDGFEEIWYKPHPGEKNEPEIDRNVKIYKETFSEALKEFSYFVGFNSTALLEAKLNSHFVIQVKEENIPGRSFEELGFGISTLDLSLLEVLSPKSFTKVNGLVAPQSFYRNFKRIIGEAR